MDRFDALQAFVRVADAGSFTRAAEALQLSRTTVTQLVQQLEAHLRARLLHRTTRKVSLTPEGSAYYARAVRLLADLEEADSAVAAALASPRGRLRVDVPSPLATRVLVPALPDFQALHPEIELHLGVSDRVVDLIDAQVDCVLRGGEITDPSLVARRVAELPLHAWAAPRYLARAGTPVHPRDLEAPQHRCVGFLGTRSGAPFPYALTRGDERQQLRGRFDLALDDGNACLAAGLAGLGVVCLPDYLARPHHVRGELVALFNGWQFEPLPLSIAYRPNRHLAARVRVFVDWVVAQLAPLTPTASGRAHTDTPTARSGR